MKRARLTPSRIIARCRAGAALCKSYNRRTGPVWSIDGEHVELRHALAAIRRGRLKPARDALFPDDDAQSWISRDVTNTECAPAARARRTC
jgi:hypothetical protein